MSAIRRSGPDRTGRILRDRAARPVLMRPKGDLTGGTAVAREHGAGPTIFIVAPGGVEEKGGIGRLIASMARYWIDSGSGPSFRIIDPYGPNRLAVMPLYFARALWQILWHGLAGRVSLLHVHMASKSSIRPRWRIRPLRRMLAFDAMCTWSSETFPASPCQRICHRARAK